LGKLKDKIAKKKKGSAETETETPDTSKTTPKAKASKEGSPEVAVKKDEGAPRVRARSKSVFAEGSQPPVKTPTPPEHTEEESATPTAPAAEERHELIPPRRKTGEELRRQIFGDDSAQEAPPSPEIKEASHVEEAPSIRESQEQKPAKPTSESVAPSKAQEAAEIAGEKRTSESRLEQTQQPTTSAQQAKQVQEPAAPAKAPYVKLGPTGRHMRDFIPAPKPKPPEPKKPERPTERPEVQGTERSKGKPSVAPAETAHVPEERSDELAAGKKRGPPTKEFRDIKPAKRVDTQRTFDARDRQGLRVTEEEQRWRKKRVVKAKAEEQVIVRPTSLSVRTPISIKDLASEMKLKASQLIAKLFLQGIIVTLNDLLEDETTIQLLGQEFGCEISIDTTEERRIQITDKTIGEEIKAAPSENLFTRPPVVAFMGHVDHGKTSLIDFIRKSNRASAEAGAITQHIGAFRCHTAVGDITILDTPGHEAFSAMRARGADVTDIVVLVIAGDEGVKQQTVEAIQHAIEAKVTIVVAINKSDKPSFNPENVYRQLADQNLLPEVWGGQILTVNCSALTGAGVKELLESLALQAEVLELRANKDSRARGTVLESEMHKGLGSVATVLVQNGTLHMGDSLVFGQHWGRVKTMHNEFGQDLLEAPPSTPVSITGLSGVPEAGQEFIVVANEREAREIAEVRQQGVRLLQMQQRKKVTSENWAQQTAPTIKKKVLNIILRADVQGSLEALRVALQKIESSKAEVNIIFTGVGEVSESDVQLAATSKAVIIGFHTKIESHAEMLTKQFGVQVKLHDIIYHAVDEVKALMTALLDKIPQETDKGKAVIKTLFKSSHAGIIAGCVVTEGTINRNNHMRVMREGLLIGRGQIASLRRVKDDVREVSKGVECGIALSKFTDLLEGDILEAYEITYLSQEL